jgi:hypothetical protein
MSVFLLCLYFTWLALQNFALPWMYRQQILSASALGVLMAGKEIILVSVIACLAYRAFHADWRLQAPDYFALAYILLLIAYLQGASFLLGSTASFSLRMISLRSVVSLALFYFWGRLSFFTLRELRHLVIFTVGLQTLVAVFGIFEWFFLPTTFWSETIGAGTFMLDLKGLLEGQNVIDGLPSNMFQFGIRRLISTYGDPLAMGIASVFPVLVCAARLLRKQSTSLSAKPRRYWWIALAVMVIALSLTIGRESIGAAAIGAFLLLWWSGKLERIAVPVAGVLVLLFFLPQIWSGVTATITFREGSAATHLRFLQTGWERLPQMIWGKGLGEAGGWAVSLAGVDNGIGESSYFDLMAQTGVLSVVLLTGFLFATARLAFRHSRQLGDPLLSSAFAAASAHTIARCVMAVFSPSLFAVVPLASFFFLCGAAFTIMQRLQLKPHLVAHRVLMLRPAADTPLRSEVGAH